MWTEVRNWETGMSAFQVSGEKAYYKLSVVTDEKFISDLRETLLTTISLLCPLRKCTNH
jgi:hypothetical protein